MARREQYTPSMDAFKTAAALDIADAKYLLALARQTLDTELEAFAIAKYRTVCDMLYTFGVAIDSLPAAA